MQRIIASTAFRSAIANIPVTVYAELWPAIPASIHTMPDEPEVQIVGVEHDGECFADFVSADELHALKDQAKSLLIDDPASLFMRLADGSELYADEVEA